MATEEAESFKEKGNAAFKERNWEEAIKQYNKAISLDPANAAYYSNRSGAWSMKGSHESALADAEKCLQNDPAFIKGYSRKGKALFDMQRWDEAEAAYNEGLGKDPNNAGCKSGVADVSAARTARAARSSSSSGMPGGLGGLGSLGGLPQKLMDTLKKGGKMQRYMMIFMAYYAFTSLTGRGSKSSSSSSSSAGKGSSVHETFEEDESDAQEDQVAQDLPTPRVGREFLEADGKWISFLRAENSKQSPLLLLLHRTSLSAEAEWATVLDRLASAGPRGGLQLLAPDRPCHGYSPCPDGGEPRNASAWLNRLIVARSSPKGIAIAAVGREAAAHAFALARRRPAVSQVWLLRPHSPGPQRGAGTKDEVVEWLQGHASAASPKAAADAANWAVRVGPSQEEPQQTIALKGAGLSKKCQVTILSDEEDQKQDEELTLALEAEGVTVSALGVGGKGDLDVLVEDVRSVLGGENSDAQEHDL